MPVQEITAEHLAGRYMPSVGEKNVPIEGVFKGQNIRQNREGGRFHRPGYQDTEVDLSGLTNTPTAGRGLISAKNPSLLWVALDDGSFVRIYYADVDAKTIYNTGLALTTLKFVNMIEWYGNVYHANGADTVGKVVVGTLAAAVSKGDTSATLTTGQGVRFPAGAFDARCEDDAFSSTGVSTETIGGIPGTGSDAFTSDHPAGAVVVTTDDLSPTYADTAKFLIEWLASLNLGGDPDAPYTHEFSKFALVSDLTEFEDFSAQPAGAEIIADNGALTGFMKTKNFLYTFAEWAINFVAREDVDATTGARIPQNLTTRFGIVNQRCVTDANGVAMFQTTNKRFTPIVIITEDASQTVSIDAEFDRDVVSYGSSIDPPDETNFTTFGESDQLVRFGVKKDGVREILVYDMNDNHFYPADTGKPFSHMVEHEQKIFALDEEGQYIFRDEFGNYDFDAPIDMVWESGRIGREFLNSTFRTFYIHGRMTLQSTATIELFADGASMFTKTLDDTYVTSTDPDDAVAVGEGGVGNPAVGGAGSTDDTFPYEYPIRLNQRGHDYKVRASYSTENGNFVQFDGMTFGIETREKLAQKHA